MSVSGGRARRRRILGFSGLLIGPERLDEATARDSRGAPPPILLVHGDQDPLIPFDAMFIAAEALAGAYIPTQWHLSLGIGHGIDAEGLRQGGLFLAKAFAEPRALGSPPNPVGGSPLGAQAKCTVLRAA